MVLMPKTKIYSEVLTYMMILSKGSDLRLCPYALVIMDMKSNELGKIKELPCMLR